MVIEREKEREVVKVDVHKLSINVKTRDSFSCSLYDKENNKIKEYIGYVPDFMPEEHYGDYLMLDIDIDTGQIMNWNVTKKQIEYFIKGEENDL